MKRTKKQQKEDARELQANTCLLIICALTGLLMYFTHSETAQCIILFGGAAAIFVLAAILS